MSDGAFDHEDYTLYLLARASVLASAEFHATLAGHGVSVAEWRVLAVLAGGESGVGRLAEACLAKQPTMSRLLDRMEGEGLVARRRGEDRRAVRVALTEAGRARAAGLTALARAHEARLLAEAEGDADALRRALKAFIARRGGGGAEADLAPGDAGRADDPADPAPAAAPAAAPRALDGRRPRP